MVRFILVRHGETDWNKLGNIQGGGSDTPLNKRGRQQAESLALRLKPQRIQAIYSSPLQRAWDTAQAIARYHEIEVKIEPALKEIDAGEFEGIPVAKVGKRFEQLLIQGGQGESIFKMPGGESLAEVQQRTWRAVQGLVDKHPEGIVVIVSHYFAILAIICTVLNLPLTQMARLRLDAGSISTIVFDGQAAHLVLFNDRCHL